MQLPYNFPFSSSSRSWATSFWILWAGVFAFAIQIYADFSA